MKPKYEIKENYCNCHPETCCCDDYKVMLGDERIFSFCYYTAGIEKIIKRANKSLRSEKK